MEIFISKSGQKHGPYTLEQINTWLTTGQVKPKALAWYEGSGGWVELWRVPGVVSGKARKLQKKYDPNKIRREKFICFIAGLVMSFFGLVLLIFAAIKSGNPFGEMHSQKLLSGFATGLLFGGLIFSLFYLRKFLKKQ